MFTISRNSWHWRVYAFTRRYAFNDHDLKYTTRVCLCPYMRTIFIYLPLWVSLIALLSAAALSAVGFVVIQLAINVPWMLYFIAGLLVLGWALARKDGQLVDAAVDFVHDHWPRREYKSNANKKPSIIWEWLKAKHKKICPCFDVVN